MLDRVDVHCIWVSNKVLSLLPKKIGDIPGGEIPAKGVFCDSAMDVVLKHYPKPDVMRKKKFVKDAMVELNELGIVGMHDAGVIVSLMVRSMFIFFADEMDHSQKIFNFTKSFLQRKTGLFGSMPWSNAMTGTLSAPNL